MFEKEAEEYREKEKNKGYYWVTQEMEQSELDTIVDETFKDGAEFGYNRGYHEAEEHYLNVIDSQHKLVDESKKKDFRKCMECTNGTYQSGFKDGYNKANEWHYVKDGDLPNTEREVLVFMWGSYYLGYYKQYDGEDRSWHFEDFDEESEQVSAWCEIPKYTEE